MALPLDLWMFAVLSGVVGGAAVRSGNDAFCFTAIGVGRPELTAACRWWCSKMRCRQEQLQVLWCHGRPDADYTARMAVVGGLWT